MNWGTDVLKSSYLMHRWDHAVKQLPTGQSNRFSELIMICSLLRTATSRSTSGGSVTHNFYLLNNLRDDDSAILGQAHGIGQTLCFFFFLQIVQCRKFCILDWKYINHQTATQIKHLVQRLFPSDHTPRLRSSLDLCEPIVECLRGALGWEERLHLLFHLPYCDADSALGRNSRWNWCSSWLYWAHQSWENWSRRWLLGWSCHLPWSTQTWRAWK